MEIYIQFRKSMWSIGLYGWRRVSTKSWKDVKRTFESLFKVQSEKYIEQTKEEICAETEKSIAEAKAKYEVLEEVFWGDLGDNDTDLYSVQQLKWLKAVKEVEKGTKGRRYEGRRDTARQERGGPTT